MTQSSYYRAVERTGAAVQGAVGATAARRAAEVLDELVAATPDAAHRACRAGCDHCCHHPVGVTFAEALRLREALHALPVEHRRELAARVHAAAAATRATPWAGLAGSPCPLLDGGLCAVHPARPLPCRAWASTDAAACGRARLGGADVPVDREAFCAGLGAAAVLAAREPTGHRELRAALAAVLGVDDTDSRATPAHARAFAAARAAGE